MEDRKEILTKYKKFYVFSLDDGVTQDIRFISLLRRYNLKATFNINTGLVGVDNTACLGGIKTPNGTQVTHKMVSEKDIREGLYAGNEVAVHTYTHPSLVKEVTDENGITFQINADFENIKKWTGNIAVGMAYPGIGVSKKQIRTNTGYIESVEFDFSNGVNISAEAVEIIKKNTTIKYGRTIDESGNFEIPKDFFFWKPTCSFKNPKLMDYAKRFNELKGDEYKLFFVWGHTYEFDCANPLKPTVNDWDRIEEFLSYISSVKDALCVTCGEAYELFSK